MDQILHLLVLDHNEVLDLLREALETVYEIRCLVRLLNLLELRHGLWLTDPRYDAALKLGVMGELPIPWLLLHRSSNWNYDIVGSIPSRKACLLSCCVLEPFMQVGAAFER